ncbi:DUF1801 domain-containing protein [Pedobacter sp. N23S346]|uniref:DUF1801 domain-containing protein n=1 Tax=Pedobacter sp. N23S346 TaxID=3402750 RepID=UPI003AD6B0FA
MRNQLSCKEQVDEYLSQLDYPFKSEIEELRSIILNASRKLSEQMKWNVPSFYYQQDFAAFHLRSKEYVQLIFIFYDGNMIEDPALLQGNWKDRRAARFYNLEDIEKKKPALEKFVNNWVDLIEKSRGL